MAIENDIELKAAYIAGRVNILPDHLRQNSDQADGMVIKRYGSKQNNSDVGETFDKSLCFNSEQQSGSVLQLGTTSSGICSKCFLNNLASNVCLCISTNLTGSQGLAAHETGTVSTHSDSTTMAKATLVSRSASDMCSKAYTATNNNSVFESAEVSNISSRSQGIQSECMVAINRQLTAKGFPRGVRDLLSASWRSGKENIMPVNSDSLVAGAVKDRLICIQHL